MANGKQLSFPNEWDAHLHSNNSSEGNACGPYVRCLGNMHGPWPDNGSTPVPPPQGTRAHWRQNAGSPRGAPAVRCSTGMCTVDISPCRGTARATSYRGPVAAARFSALLMLPCISIIWNPHAASGWACLASCCMLTHACTPAWRLRAPTCTVHSVTLRDTTASGNSCTGSRDSW